MCLCVCKTTRDRVVSTPEGSDESRAHHHPGHKVASSFHTSIKEVASPNLSCFICRQAKAATKRTWVNPAFQVRSFAALAGPEWEGGLFGNSVAGESSPGSGENCHRAATVNHAKLLFQCPAMMQTAQERCHRFKTVAASAVAFVMEGEQCNDSELCPKLVLALNAAA